MTPGARSRRRQHPWGGPDTKLDAVLALTAKMSRHAAARDATDAAEALASVVVEVAGVAAVKAGADRRARATYPEPAQLAFAERSTYEIEGGPTSAAFGWA